VLGGKHTRQATTLPAVTSSPLPSPDPSTLAAADQIFAARTTASIAPSVSYGILAGGRLVHSAGFGAFDDAGEIPGPDTAYRIASCTKSFTVTALLILRDAGVLDLDTPITELIPVASLRLPNSTSPSPSVRMLMSMSSGLPTDDPWGDRQESLTNDEFDAVLAAGLRFVTVPGTAFEYSNLGYALLGRVIEVVSGRGYRNFVASEVFAPAGLSSTGFDVSVPAAGGLATGYRRLDHTWRALPFAGPGAFSPIGGIFSTVSDLTRWMQVFVDAFADDPATTGPAGRPVLAAASRREMQQLQRVIPPGPGSTATGVAGYGFGLFVQHDPHYGHVVSHSGGYPGFNSHMRWHPESGLGVVALENATYAGVGAAVTTALDLLLDRAGAVRQSSAPWPETLRAKETVDELLGHWDDSTALAMFADNVVLDDALDRRRDHIAAAVAAVGGLAPSPRAATGPGDWRRGDGDVVSESAAHLQWTVAGVHGRLQCEIRLNPQDPPLVQTLTVRVLDAIG
jgi:CubicO group peptidase (beta-lactamase class C family)